MSWKPIETAPRDGTPMLLMSPDGRVGIGLINESHYHGILLVHAPAAWAGVMHGDKPNVSLGGYEATEALEWHPIPSGALL